MHMKCKCDTEFCVHCLRTNPRTTTAILQENTGHINHKVLRRFREQGTRVLTDSQSLRADMAGNGSVGERHFKCGDQQSFWLSGCCVLCLFRLWAVRRLCPPGASLGEILSRFWQMWLTTATWQDLLLNLSASLQQKHTGHLHKKKFFWDFL